MATRRARIYINARVRTAWEKHPETGERYTPTRVMAVGTVQQVTWNGDDSIFVPYRTYALGYTGEQVDGHFIFRGYGPFASRSPELVAIPRQEWQRLAVRAYRDRTDGRAPVEPTPHMFPTKTPSRKALERAAALARGHGYDLLAKQIEALPDEE